MPAAGHPAGWPNGGGCQHMRSASGGPRVLLRRLRETMAEKVSAQERLDKIVVLIAANMVAEVCSTYVLRVDNTLELYATGGLNCAAVHRTVLSAHEGLVGLVASEATPLNLNDAQSHPAFSFRPETGEEIYHSFLGVPILRAGNTLGVLVVQNRAQRTYSEEEEEALATTAMVLAEMIASGELSALAQPGAELPLRRPLNLKGTALNDGIALGHVVLHEPRVVITNFIADDLPRERTRLDNALETLRADLDRMFEHGDVAAAGEHRDVLEAYRMFANDRGWVHKLEEAVMTGLTAEAAVERVHSDIRARMLRQTDPYLRERLPDLACGDRRPRARHRGGRRGGKCHRPRRSGRRHHRRRRDRRRAPAPDVRGAGGLCRPGALARAAPAAIPRAARQAVRHPRRRGGDASGQCRPRGRSAADLRDRRGGHRALSHRNAVHGRDPVPARGRAAAALPGGARRRGRAAGDVPHPRHRRRQGAALHAQRRGGDPGTGLARDPPRPRPSRPPAQPGAGDAARRLRA